MSTPDRHPETLAGDVANAARIPVTGGVLYFGERRSNPNAALLDTHAVDASGRASHWIYTDLTREQGTALRDALSTWLNTAPAPAASSPASQAVTGTVAEPSSVTAPVARDIGMCRCGHVIGEHVFLSDECTGSDLSCSCTEYLPVGGAS